jgi:hypothetical protein
MQEVSQHIEAGDVVPWLRVRIPEADLSRVANRGLCLLIAWTAELIQRGSWEAD